MRRVMVFIDFENFNIAFMSYYRSIGEPYPRLDYNKVPQEIVKLIPGGNELVKTFLCAPKPDDFLAQDERRAGTYRWINGLKNQPYFTVIEGRHVARPVSGQTFSTMDISDPTTYYVEEKGTDINMGTHILAKGFLNAYDTAVIVSGDTDYMPVLDVLNTIGKIAVCVGVKGQNMVKLKTHSDDIIILDEKYFGRCLRPPHTSQD